MNSIRTLSVAAAVLGVALTMTACTPADNTAAPTASASASPSVTPTTPSDNPAAPLPERVTDINATTTGDEQTRNLTVSSSAPVEVEDLKAILLNAATTDEARVVFTFENDKGAPSDVIGAAFELGIPIEGVPGGFAVWTEDIRTLG